MPNLKTAALLPLAFLAACATRSNELSAYPDLQVALRELQGEQTRFAAATQVPQKLDFPGQGQVTIRQLSLDGYPGNTYLRCRWHYQNNTGKPIVRALVSLDVLDSDGRMVASQVSVCLFPSGRPIYEGTFFADELRTSTHDVHLQPGWSWRMTCKADYQDAADLEADRKAQEKLDAQHQAELQRLQQPIIRKQ